ncbi:hypothetical protein EV382_3267 [Micromonospora violae]|uniref:Uncharacterized protein n=2 Tax=Micromonospora violae TaxID=1278207 RepID=A0A4Q7UGQ7_9ACTN|nr:hypothetical protein EV382_3267 [Micromonospora violae]
MAFGVLPGAAGSASAEPTTTRATAVYVNDIIRQNIWDYYLCLGEAQHRNTYTYGNPNGIINGDYFYCAKRDAGGWNLWWRHRA